MKRYSIFMDRKPLSRCHCFFSIICRFNVISIKISMSHSVDINKLILMLIQISKRLRIANTILKEKSSIRGFPCFTSKQYKATEIKTVWQKGRQIDKLNRMEQIQFFSRQCQNNWTSTCKKKMHLDSDFILFTTINSKETI